MAQPGQGPFIGGRQVTPQEMEQRMAEEAKKHGLTVEQFKQIQIMQQKRLEAEAAKAGMTPQQFIQMQQQKLIEEAAKANMSPQQFLAVKQQEAIQQQRQAAQQQQGQPPANGQPPGPPGQTMQKIDLTKPVEAKPEALAVAKFLRSQNLKLRTCVFEGNRKDMFKGKRFFNPSCAVLTSHSQTSPPCPTIGRLRESPCERPSPSTRHKRHGSTKCPTTYASEYACPPNRQNEPRRPQSQENKTS